MTPTTVISAPLAHHDRVVTSAFAARLWERAQERRRADLAAQLLQLELETWLEAGSPLDAT